MTARSRAESSVGIVVPPEADEGPFVTTTVTHFGIFDNRIAHCTGDEVRFRPARRAISHNPRGGTPGRRMDAGRPGEETWPATILRVEVRAGRTAPRRHRIPRC